MTFSNVVVTVSSDSHATVIITIEPRAEAITTVNITPQTASNNNHAPGTFYLGSNLYNYIQMSFNIVNVPNEAAVEPDTPMSIDSTPPPVATPIGSNNVPVVEPLSEIEQTDDDVIFLTSIPPSDLLSMSNTGLYTNSPIILMGRHSCYGNDGVHYEWYEPFFSDNSHDDNQQQQ